MNRTHSILPPGQGPKYWLVGDQLTFKITGERSGGAFTLAEDYIVPQHGPPPHVHHREHESFYVIDGQFLFAGGKSAVIGGPGTAVFLPKDVPHVFKNVGDRPGQLLLIAAPAGFEAMVVEAGQAVPVIPFEKQVGPADIEKLLAVAPNFGLEVQPAWQPAAPTAPGRRDRKLWVLGQLVTLKLTSKETAGTLSLAEIRSLPGQGVPAHSHRAMDELFYVLDGTWEFTVAGETRRVGPGGLVHVPVGVTHAFRNVGAAPARLLDYHLPGGFEAFFEDAGVEAGDESGPPEMSPPDRAQLLALFDRHGMDVAG